MGIKTQTGIVERKQDLTGDGGEAIAAALANKPATTNSEISDTSNILNAYRSVNYNFTIAALTPDNLKYPASYRDSALKYVVLSTKGKGPNAISSNIVPRKTTKDVPVLITDEDGKIDGIGTKKVAGEDDVSGVDIVNGFNKESPGKFELYMDDLEIDSIMAPNEKTGTSLSTSVRFEVIEPLSVNGFIEALHTTAIAAGWSGYLNAAFLLKIDFVGYADNVDLPEPEAIKASKYIPIKFTGAEMSVTEQGTKYRCSAIPFTEAGYGNPNQIYTDISFSGRTVKSVLESLFEAINKSVDERERKEQKSDSTNVLRDKYEIYFPKEPNIGEPLKIEKSDDGNKIASESINQHLRDNAIYKFPPKPTPGGRGAAQAEQFREQFRLNPQVSQIQFAKDSQITDIITAVIRDSNYLKGILEDPNTAKDSAGMIDYFQIVLNMIPLGLDKTTNVYKYIYQFLVVPYKVHYTRLPTQQSKSFSAKELLPFVKRTYDYIYTGNNIDVLNFKLNFNNLFFQASNPKMGNSDQSETASGAGPAGVQNKSIPKDAAAGAKNSKQDIAPILSNGPSSSFGGRAGPSRTDPYYQLAYNAHQAILESVNLLTAEVEIVGDPFYLSTSGTANYFPAIKQLGLTSDGEAAPAFGPVLCRVNFSNPVDIDPTTGQYTFAELAPFSGVYQVINCKNIFRNGAFTQRLKLIRFSGQLDDPKEKSKPLLFVQEPKKGEQPRKDSAAPDVPKQGVKLNDINMQNILDRGVPEATVPGPEANPLNQIAKAAFGVGAVLAGVDLLKGGLKLDVNTIAGLAAVTVGASSLLNQAGNVAKSILPGSAANLLSSDVTKSLSGSVSQVSNLTGNLGAGVSATTNNILKTANGLSVKDGSGNPILTGAAALNPAGSVGNVSDKIGNLTSVPTSGLSTAQKNAVLADAKAKGIPADQALRNASLFGVNLPGVASNNGALASKLGIDTSALSGLTGLDSNIIDKIKQAAESIPKNTDLGKIKNQGVIMGDMSADSFKNLPAIPPELKAPLAALPSRSVSSTLTAEQRTAVIADAKAKGIPVDQALRNASMFGVNLKGLTPEAQAIAISNNPQALAGNTAALGALGISSADIASGKFDTIAKQMQQLNPGIPSINDTMAGLKGALSSNSLKTGVGNLSNGFGSIADGVTGGLTKIGNSVEGLAANIQSALGNPGTNLSLSNMGKTAVAQFGSLSSSIGSPLNKLMNTTVNSLNDPNAPPYTGDDPIIRARLGLPPVNNLDDGDFA